MQALIDGDVLVYELGFSSERINDAGELEPSSWDFVRDLIERKIQIIKAETEAFEEPKIFLTTNAFLHEQLNKRRKWSGEALRDFTPNFREIISVTKEYKGGRKLQKPFHYKNILSHFLTEYNAIVSEDGLEADDLMCITQYNSEPNTTIICSRDKDLRMCPGWHYSWECGEQPSIGPVLVDGVGWLEKKEEIKTKDDGTEYKSVKWLGFGPKFFYFQMIMGDAVDNIPGLKRKGPVYAYELLKDVEDEHTMYELVKAEYKNVMKDNWLPYMKEQANLLWMIREVDEKGKPIMYRPPL